ncbi:MAG: DUF1667 domain-containing protein [Ruminococcus sp.]|nr:DUF1667 domain-containing protein [Ruminococcus sp.]
MEKRELTCIGCPMGCLVTVTLDGGEILSVTGHTCKRGEIYAKKEVTDPTRIVTSTVRVSGGVKERVSCKTREDIPKDKIFAVMEEINRVTVPAPIGIGDILIENAASTGVAIIATANVQKA